MKRTFPTLALLGMISLSGLAWQQAGQAEDTEALASQAENASPAEAVVIAEGPHAEAIRDLLDALPGAGDERDAAVEAFRERGAEGFAALYEALAPQVEMYRAAKGFGFEQGAAEVEPLVRLLDQVAQQRDAYAAGLYWHTDLESAKRDAQATGKPILSLRMLGNLDDEYSCANSRFFRTVLYADDQLGQALRDRFVLHWQSVRPVPVITIDMGDGRVIRRTITGNSCHLVLDSEGRPIDVIPGLYGPRTFEEKIHHARGMLLLLEDEQSTDREALLARYHAKAVIRLDNRWLELTPTLPVEAEHADASLAVGAQVASTEPAEVFTDVDLDEFWEELAIDAIFRPLPTARDAATRVVGKTSIEAVFIDIIMPNMALTAIDAPGQADAEVWDAVAAFYAEGAGLDPASRRLITEKTITAEQAMAMAFGKRRVEDPLLAMVRNFEGAIALDTARNEHLLHRQIHQWFVDGEAPMDADELTSRVYAELFLTPDEDPWLGLVPADTYSALDAGGLEVCDAP